MILISERTLNNILYEIDISPEEKNKLMAKIIDYSRIINYNLCEEDDEESLLGALTSKKFNVNSDPAEIHKYRTMYLGIKRYLEGKITLETVYNYYLNNYCPPSGYSWCEKEKTNNCDSCDLNQKQWSDGDRCLECWKRTLKIEKERLKKQEGVE